MINEKRAKEKCCESLENIEGYSEAVADTTQIWCCHHRFGVKDDVTVTPELIANDMYYHRPACELIFVTPSQHKELHRDLCAKGGKKGGKTTCAKKTFEQRSKMTKGKHWWNNGVVTKRAFESPGPGFVRGRLKHS